MGITVIPAYRVVARLARRVRRLPYEEALNTLEQDLRLYVRNLLSMLPPSFTEIGERSAVVQLGDPDLDRLVDALGRIEAAEPKVLVEEAVALCARRLPRPDLNARVFLLPGDGESRVLTAQQHGVMGFSLGHQAMLLFLWPAPDWQRWLSYTVAHEYVHLVRNLLFPRGMSGGRLIYMKSQEPETLLDAMVAEGLADAFALSLYPELDPPWTRALDPRTEARLWPRVRRRLRVWDTNEIRRILYGDGDRIPLWTGYTVGYRMVRGYLQAHPEARPEDLVGLPARRIYEGSGYMAPRAAANPPKDEAAGERM